MYIAMFVVEKSYLYINISRHIRLGENKKLQRLTGAFPLHLPGYSELQRYIHIERYRYRVCGRCMKCKNRNPGSNRIKEF